MKLKQKTNYPNIIEWIDINYPSDELEMYHFPAAMYFNDPLFSARDYIFKDEKHNNVSPMD